jgi:hypothetical protein
VRATRLDAGFVHFSDGDGLIRVGFADREFGTRRYVLLQRSRSVSAAGYNTVTVPGRRERAGCLAHLRRKFFDAQSYAPDAAKRAMNFILDVYVGHDEAGENLAGLYSLIATCEANEVNPVEYLDSVLLRVQTHPASRIDELLPQNWKPPTSEPPT